MPEPAPRRRVVYLDHTAHVSGGELALLRFLEALDGAVDAHLILFEDGPLADRARALGAVVEILPLGDRARMHRKDDVAAGRPDPGAVAEVVLHLRRLRSRLVQIRPHLVHANSLKAGFVGCLAARASRIPAIWHVHDRLAPDYLPPNAVRLTRAGVQWLPHAAIATSATVRATLPAGQRVAVINPPLKLGPKPLPAGNNHVPRIGIIGRIAPWKGQDVFLRAFAEAFPGPGAEAVVVGAPLFGAEETGFAASLRDLARDLGVSDRVNFRGFREDIRSELDELDILVHASTSPEPWGQVVCEGMAAGRPVIAANAGGPAEIVSHGRTGLLVAPSDVAALAAAMRSLASDPDRRRQLGDAGRVAIASRVDYSRAARQLLAFYDEIARPAG